MDTSEITRLFEIFEKINPAPASELRFRDPFELLCAVVLSARTTDAAVNRVTPALFARAPDPAALAALDPAELERIISSIGLYRSKARHLTALAARLVRDFGGKVPETEAELVSLPGVGRKTARVVLNIAFGKGTVAVDTHIFRVAGRLGLSDAPDPDKMSDDLAAKIPERFLRNAHHHLILHGRCVCAARRPACASCPVSSLCRTFRENARAGAENALKNSTE